jgi:hypothetical protein
LLELELELELDTICLIASSRDTHKITEKEIDLKRHKITEKEIDGIFFFEDERK